MSYQITQTCTGCGACKILCPVFAIEGEPKQAHSINPKRCIECGVCGRACPKEAVADANGQQLSRIPRSQWPKPTIDESRCSACGICTDACTPGALRISRPKSRGDIRVHAELHAPAKCVGCALCERRCPLHAISMCRGGYHPPVKMKLPIYAHINLSNGSIETKPIPESWFKKYIGGKTLAARLLLDLCPQGVDPLAPEAVLIINTGPLNATGAPCSSRFNMSFKNVLTGGVASSNCGGNFGVMLKRAGLDGLVITGKSEAPVHIEITDGDITLHSAAELWGLDTEETQARLPAHFGKLVIGPAGENLVRYASAISGERVAGRCGAGAVLGSKNIKALSAYGSAEPSILRKEKFDRFVAKWVKFLHKHPMTGDSLPHYGSAGLVNKANASHALPTRNFREGHFADADKVSGETLAETRLLRNSGCTSCPIRCERRILIDEREVKGPEYETLGLFGPNIGASDMEAIFQINTLCDQLGLDTISAAGTIAFAMELKEKGIADFGVEFGKTDNITRVIQQIARREGIYAELANGSKWLSEKYGGTDFAMHAKGLELASYEPRRSVGMGLGYATSNRGGCHLNGGYLALLESVGVLSLDPQSHKAKAQWSVFMQDALDAVSSSGFCLFSAQTFVPAVFFRLGPNHGVTRATGKIFTHAGPLVRLILWMAPILRFNSFYLLPHAEALRLATGLRMYTGPFIRFGARGYNLERLFNLREGVNRDALPERLTQTPQEETRPDTTVPLPKLLKKYYQTRGWDKTGVPKPRTLKRLGIALPKPTHL
ncbi:MAG: 4Fe-4S binding protein [Clostridiales bacterium]|nr:4Fe-4S binding protein [Clostridiales bacterium]